jgi:cell division protein FtsA
MNELSRRAQLSLPPALPPEPPARSVRNYRTGPFGVLDIGSTKIACLIGRTDSDGELRALGSGLTRSRGVRGGGITDLDEAERAIRAAVAMAEEMADYRLRSVTVNLSCGQPESRLFNVQWPVSGRQVADSDVRRVISEGRARAVTEGRETIHSLPLNFAVDETAGVADPRGHHCDVLSARLHVVDALSMALRNLGNAVHRCDLEISEVVSAPFAAGLSCLVEDERELGATIVDMGGGTTSLAVFFEGQLLHTAHIPVGGQHVTRDIAGVLSTPIDNAERLKTLYGNVHACQEDEREILAVQLIGEEDHQFAKFPRSMVIGIIRPRLEETFEMVRDRLDGAGLGRAASGRVVLTGGASQLVGVRDLAHKILDRPVRLGRPSAVRALAESASGPAFATATGLLAWAAGEGRTLADIDLHADRPSGLISRIVDFLRERV